jgi:DNA-binding GntR family transcriptional regulator
VNAARFDRSSTAVRIADALRERIAAGALAPGSRIVELDVAREFGVSRSPVREALLRLAEGGLVTILPYRGAVVVPLEHRHLVELLEFRLALERFALQRLIEGGDVGSFAMLREHVVAIADAIRAHDVQRAVDADLETHAAMVRLAGNTLLLRAYDGLRDQFRRYIHLTSAHYERAEDLADEHVTMLDAAERGDAALALRILDAHIMHGFEEALVEPKS